MSKPLTIEELKALEVGDWAFIKDDYCKVHSNVCYLGLSVWNWGFGDPVFYSYTDYGKTWLAYKNKEQAEGKDDSLAVQLEVAERDNENLERTIEELHEVLSANGISIDSDGNVNVEQVRKEVAKEILQTLHYETDREKEASNLYNDFNYGLDIALGKIENLAEKYGVEVDK